MSFLRFYIEKTILELCLPPAGPFLMLLAGIILRWTHYKKLAKMLSITGVVLLYLLSLSPISDMLITPLENEYEFLSETPLRADAVVVLTSGVKDFSDLGIGPIPSDQSLRRLVEAICLHRKTDSVPLIICGGAGDPAKQNISEGKTLADMAIALGVSRDALLIEDRSRNTHEGARNVKKLMGDTGKNIVLVTSASHMGRAVYFFKKEGLDVIPAPVDFTEKNRKISPALLLPSAGALETSSIAAYEYLCRLRYLIPLKRNFTARATGEVSMQIKAL